jgi:hypothetical protein
MVETRNNKDTMGGGGEAPPDPHTPIQHSPAKGQSPKKGRPSNPSSPTSPARSTRSHTSSTSGMGTPQQQREISTGKQRLGSTKDGAVVVHETADAAESPSPTSPAISTSSTKTSTAGMRTPQESQETDPSTQGIETVTDQGLTTQAGSSGGHVVTVTADATTAATPGIPSTAAVTPLKSPQSEASSVDSDAFSEDSSSSVDEINKPQKDATTPTVNNDVSFDEVFPFVKDKIQTSPKNKKKGKLTTPKVFLETYNNFKTYMLRTELNKMPSIRLNRAAGKIYVASDGTSPGA